MQRQTLTISSVQLSYLEWQDARDREPVVLLHGLADNALVWSSLGETLAANYRVVAPDLRGHGNSSKPDSSYSFEEIIGDLEALMDSLGWRSAHVIGHSWAGKLVAIWAQRSSDRLRSATLVDPFFFWKLPDWMRITFPLLYRTLPFLQGMGPFADRETAERQARRMKQYRDWTPNQQTAFWAGVEAKPDGTWGSKFTVTARDRIFTESMRVPALTDAIALPTLLIQPEKGLNRSPLQIVPYRKKIPNLKLQRVPGNHWAFLVAPNPFNRAIADFLHYQRESPSIRE